MRVCLCLVNKSGPFFHHAGAPGAIGGDIFGRAASGAPDPPGPPCRVGLVCVDVCFLSSVEDS